MINTVHFSHDLLTYLLIYFNESQHDNAVMIMTLATPIRTVRLVTTITRFLPQHGITTERQATGSYRIRLV